MSNNQVKSENDTRKIFTTLILVLTLMICTTSATYAYFALSAVNNNVVTGNAATASLTLTVTPPTLRTNTGVMVPQYENALSKAMNSTNQCVDTNGNIVCKVYTVTVTNGSTAAVKLNGTISFTGTNTSMVNLKWRRVDGLTTLGNNDTGSYSSTNTSVCTLNSGSTACTTFPTYDLIAGCDYSSTECNRTDVTLAKTGVTGNSQTYYFVFWINETGNEQKDSGTWKATITFTGEDGKGLTSTITS